MSRLAAETRALTGIVRRWTGRAGAGFFDQALVSGSNFIVAVLAGRWLSSDQYGSFGIAMSIYIIAYGLHQALVEEPLSVLGAAPGPRGFAFLRGLLPFHGIIALASGGFLLVASFAFRDSALGQALLGLGIAAPAVLHHSYRRRTSYLRRDYRLVLRGGVVYAVVQLTALAGIRLGGFVGPATVFLPMALAGAAAAGAMAHRVDRQTTDRHEGPSWKDVAAESVRFGRWGAASQVTYWGSTALYGPLLGLVAGLGAAGVFKAHTNLAMPLGQTVTAVSLVVLPHLSQRGAESGAAYLRPAINRMMLLAGLIGGAYAVAVAIFAVPLTDMLYGNPLYTSFAGLAILLVSAQAVSGVRQGLYLGSKAMLQPQLVFWGQAAGAMVTLTLGVFLVLRLGVIGAGLGQLISNIAETAWLWWTVRVRMQSGVAGGAVQ